MNWKVLDNKYFKITLTIALIMSVASISGTVVGFKTGNFAMVISGAMLPLFIVKIVQIEYIKFEKGEKLNGLSHYLKLLVIALLMTSMIFLSKMYING